MKGFNEISKDEAMSTDGGFLLALAIDVYIGYKVYEYYKGVYDAEYAKTIHDYSE